MKKSVFRFTQKIILTVLIIFSSVNAQSAIIDFGNYFSDDDSGLYWLDVTPTVNRSYIDISAQLGASGEFSGWRYATTQEFNRLLLNWTGIPKAASGPTFTTNTLPSVDGLVELFGSTLDTLWINRNGLTWDADKGYPEGAGIDFTLGILADNFNNNLSLRLVGAIWDNEANGSNPQDFYNAMHRQVSVTNAQYDIGSFLVRGDSPNGSPVTNVAEPQSFILLGLGLLGLWGSRRNMKR